MSKTYTYSFVNVGVTVNNLLVTGFWEGDDVVEVAPNSDNATPIVGADGQSTVSYSADDSVLLTLRLKPASPMNAILNSFYSRARAGQFGSGFPVSVRDTGTGEGGASAEAHVVQAPTRTFGGNASQREWVLFCPAWEWSHISYTVT